MPDEQARLAGLLSLLLSAARSQTGNASPFAAAAGKTKPPDEMSEMELDNFIKAISDRYKNLNFVQRYLEPEKFSSIPVLDVPGKPGWIATHQMSYSGPDRLGRYMVYPSIIYDKNTNKLQWLQGRAPVDYALATGEYIPFASREEADLFSREYKRAAGNRKALERR